MDKKVFCLHLVTHTWIEAVYGNVNSEDDCESTCVLRDFFYLDVVVDSNAGGMLAVAPPVILLDIEWVPGRLGQWKRGMLAGTASVTAPSRSTVDGSDISLCNGAIPQWMLLRRWRKKVYISLFAPHQ